MKTTRRKPQAHALPPKYFTVAPPEGIRMYAGRGFCTDIVPHGATLEFVPGETHMARPIGDRNALAYVSFKHVETGRMYRLEYTRVRKFVEDGWLKE